MTTHYDALIRVRFTSENKEWAEHRAREIVSSVEYFVEPAELVSVEPAAPAGEGQKS